MNIHILSRIIDKTIWYVVLHPVSLTLVWTSSSISDEIDTILDEDGVNDEEKSLLENIRKNGLDTIVLHKPHMIMKSMQTGNTDRRSGGCGDMIFTKDDFVWKQHNPTGITLRQLIESVYRMKGSKYDWWYEHFSSIHLVEDTENSYTLCAEFDYGS